MRKIAMILLGAVLIAGYGLNGVMAGDEDTMCIPMGSILIEPPDGVDAKRSPVEFPHSIHFTYACNTCHHTWEYDAPILSCTTSGCHDLTSSRSEDGKLDPQLALRNFKNAYHDSCIACHQKIKQKNRQIEKSYTLTEPMQSSGPTGCNECHPK